MHEPPLFSYPMAEAPSLKTGLFLIVSALLLLIFGSYATFFEAFLHRHQTGIWVSVEF